MIYEIRHVTAYAYEAPVSASRCTLRLTPRDGGRQRVLAHEVTLRPQPARLQEREEFFGARVLDVAVEGSHRKLVIEARSRVEVAPPDLLPLDTPWEEVGAAAASAASLKASSPAHHLFASRLVALDDEVAAYAAESFPAGRPVLEAGLDLARRIHRDFAYAPGTTEISTSPAEALARRRGVCQDFAHVAVAGLRALGLPAAYVSGYIHTTPPPGRPRLVGADATHAWISLWCGETLGWVDLDPTNGIPVGDGHVVLAVGRDYADVSPVDGVAAGGGAQRLNVSVDVTPVG